MTEPTSQQQQLLDATTPEALAALMGGRDTQGDTQDVPTGQQDAAADAEAVPAAPAGASSDANTEQAAEPAGVATKSGSGVLPYRVLADERAAKQRYRDQATALQAQLAEAQEKLQQLQATGASQDQQQQALDDLTDEEIAEAAADFPLLAKVARKLKQTASTAAAVSKQADTDDAADEEAAAQHAAAQAALDAMRDKPLLLKARDSGGVLWARVVELDQQLASDPNKSWGSLSARAAEVQRLLATELGVPVQPPQQQQRQAAQADLEPKPFRPNTSSDLAGGVAANGDGINEQADGMALARRFSTMTPEQINAAIRRSA